MNELEKHFEDQAEIHERLVSLGLRTTMKPADWVKRYDYVFKEASATPLPSNPSPFDGPTHTNPYLEEINALKAKQKELLAEVRDRTLEVDFLEGQVDYFRDQLSKANLDE